MDLSALKSPIPRAVGLLCLLLAACGVWAVNLEYEGRPAVVLSNGRLELVVTLTGATLVNLVLLQDSTRVSPFWNEARAIRMAGDGFPAIGGFGHFLCLDGFGEPSPEERPARYPLRGEAHNRHFEILLSTKTPPVSTMMLGATLPLAQEMIIRRVQMVEGENVVYVDTEVENLRAVGRPVSWAEHAAIGPPFLEGGEVVVDMPATRCRVGAEKRGPAPVRLSALRDFDWPMAPSPAGGTIDLREVSIIPSYDLVSCQTDPRREYGYVTALHKSKRLLFGYVFRRRDFPWLMSWMNHPGDGRVARGMEFSTHPFDLSRREAVAVRELSGTPTYAWLPAKARMRSRFLLFYTSVPDGFSSVDDVTLENGRLQIKNRTGQSFSLSAILPL